MPIPMSSWEVHSEQWVVNEPNYALCVKHININPSEIRVFYGIKELSAEPINIDVILSTELEKSIVIVHQHLGEIDEWKLSVLHVANPIDAFQSILLRVTYKTESRILLLLKQIREQSHRNTTWSYFNSGVYPLTEVEWNGPATEREIAYFVVNKKKMYVRMDDASEVKVISEDLC